MHQNAQFVNFRSFSVEILDILDTRDENCLNHLLHLIDEFSEIILKVVHHDVLIGPLCVIAKSSPIIHHQIDVSGPSEIAIWLCKQIIDQISSNQNIVVLPHE